MPLNWFLGAKFGRYCQRVRGRDHECFAIAIAIELGLGA